MERYKWTVTLHISGGDAETTFTIMASHVKKTGRQQLDADGTIMEFADEISIEPLALYALTDGIHIFEQTMMTTDEADHRQRCEKIKKTGRWWVNMTKPKEQPKG